MPIINPPYLQRSFAAGVFYLVLTPRRWQLLGWRYDDYPSVMDHSHFWETEVCSYLANIWLARVRRHRPKASSEWLRAALIGHYTAFPRGRIAQGERGLAVYWGENFPAGALHLKPAIRRYFGLPRNTRWIRDDHELCLSCDYQAVHAHLSLGIAWESVA